MTKNMTILSISISTICIIGGGILYNSHFDDIPSSPSIAIENLDILEERVPSIVEQLNYKEIQPPKVDTSKEKHRLSIVEKEVATLTTEADIFIKTNKLILPSNTTISEKKQLVAQKRINTVLNKLDSLESQLDTYAQSGETK